MSIDRLAEQSLSGVTHSIGTGTPATGQPRIRHCTITAGMCPAQGGAAYFGAQKRTLNG